MPKRRQDSTITVDRRLYLDADGKVVEANDPRRARLLVGAGGRISRADAERYGLLNETDTDSKAKSGPPQHKAKAGPRADKDEG